VAAIINPSGNTDREGIFQLKRRRDPRSHPKHTDKYSCSGPKRRSAERSNCTIRQQVFQRIHSATSHAVTQRGNASSVQCGFDQHRHCERGWRSTSEESMSTLPCHTTCLISRKRRKLLVQPRQMLLVALSPPTQISTPPTKNRRPAPPPTKELIMAAALISIPPFSLQLPPSQSKSSSIPTVLTMPKTGRIFQANGQPAPSYIEEVNTKVQY
jgi:hypothetical protein